ncbi:MAG: hemolysin III family protein [Actinomycetota bacterium]|nr:hemolysin III family protein [Actinomycetota bacterium]
MARRDLETVSEARVKPRLRGASHQYAFVLAVVAGTVVVAGAETTRSRVAVAVYALSVAAMFGSSALYHRVDWPPAQRRTLRRLDHAMIYLLIAGTYTPFATLALSGAARVAILALVWVGALAGIVLAFAWSNRPKWVEVVLAVALGWIGVVVLPQLVEAVGGTAVGLVIAGGVFYTAGSVVYARGRPDPIPAVFGYHELFHALVVVAAACQYAAIASFVL